MFPYFEKNHLEKVCMSYVEHILLSFKLTICFFLGGICACIHGFIPNLFPKSSTFFSEYIASEIKKNGCKHNSNGTVNADSAIVENTDALYKQD